MDDLTLRAAFRTTMLRTTMLRTTMLCTSFVGLTLGAAPARAAAPTRRVHDEAQATALTAQSAAAQPAAAQPAAAQPAAAQPAPPSQAAESGQPDRAPARQTLGALGWAGVAAAALGGSAILGGITLLGLAQNRVVQQPTQIRDYRGAGYGLAGGGVAAMAAGVAMLVLDKTRNKRSQRRAALLPAVGPTQVGARAVFRF